MKTKNACVLLLAALALTACEYDDSALWEQVNQNTERIAALEAWQAETNTNIQSLQTLLNTTDHITAVTTVMEEGVEVGYTISFLKSDPVTIYHGKKGDEGDTPQIGVTQGKDGNWYWTLNGKPLTDANENPIRANGEKGDEGDTGASAPVPQLKTGASLTVSKDSEGADIVDDAIYLSVDEGKTWTRVSGTDGDSFFSKVDTSDPTCVIFTLADGTTTFSVPRYTGIKLTFDTEGVHLGYGGTLPVNFTAEGSESFTTDNLFIIAPDGWKAEVTLPTTRAATKFILNVTAPADATSGAAEGEILMMLDNQQGNTTIGRIKVDCKSTNLVMNNVTTAGALAKAIGNRTNLTSITVTSGTLNETDWAAVVKNNAALLYLDLAGATYEGTDKDNLIYRTTGVTPPIISIKLPQGITTLGDNAFYKCTSLTSIDLPEGVTSIGTLAFGGCSVLTSIDLPETLTSIGGNAFAACYALTSITLPDKVTSIAGYAFFNCTKLTTVTLPDGLESIRNNVFGGCTSLTSITLPDKVTSIGDYAFQNCDALTSIDLPEGLTSIGYMAFNNCKALTSITLPDKVTSIGNSAFSNCSALESIDLPEGLTSIGEYTFYNCSALTSIDLPAGVTGIGRFAFYKCNKLTTVTLPEGLESIGEAAFNYCSALTSIDLPEGVKSIGNYAFAGCTALESIDLSDGLESIGNNVFAGCNSLTSIDLPEELKSIGEYAFHNCNSLTSIDLPAGVTSIGESAFNYCKALITVTCQATKVPGLGDKAFNYCSKLANIYVPAGSVDDYKAAAGWSAYATKIQPIQ